MISSEKKPLLATCQAMVAVVELGVPAQPSPGDALQRRIDHSGRAHSDVQERPRNRRQDDRAGDADPQLGEAAVEEAAKHDLFHHRRRNRHRDDMDEQAAGRARGRSHAD